MRKVIKQQYKKKSMANKIDNRNENQEQKNSTKNFSNKKSRIKKI